MEQKAAEEIPKRFWREGFCKAVTGYTRDQLLGFINREYIDHMVEHLEKKKAKYNPRDTPRGPADESADRMLIFANSKFRADLSGIPAEELYQAFVKFKEYVDYIGHEPSWGPEIYRKIEEAHQKRNETELKGAIIELVDEIIHD